MKRTAAVLVMLAVVVGAAVTATAQSDERKDRLFDRLMEVMGGADLVKKIQDDLLRRLPPDQAARLARAFDPAEVLAVIRPVYLRHLSESDLRAIIHFYLSPAGRRLLAVRPQLMAEVLQAVTNYARRKLGLAPAAPPAPAPSSGPPAPAPAPGPSATPPPAPVKPAPIKPITPPPVKLPPSPGQGGPGPSSGTAPDGAGGSGAAPSPPTPASEVIRPAGR